MASIAVPLLSAGVGALGSIFGGNRMSRQQQEALRFWLQRMRDQETRATEDYSGSIDPETGQWTPGSRGRAVSAYEDIYAEPGFTGEEQAGLYLSPEEQAAMYLSPEEQEAIRLSPQYREQMTARNVAPITGTGEAAARNLTRAGAARGNYGGGYGATIRDIMGKQARLSAEAVRDVNLDLSDIDRRTAEYLAEHRTGTAGDIAAQRIGATGAIGEARMRGREVGAGGRERMAGGDRSMMIGYGSQGQYGAQNTPAMPPPTWAQGVTGAIGGLSPWLTDWMRSRNSRRGGVSIEPRTSDFPINRQTFP